MTDAIITLNGRDLEARNISFNLTKHSPVKTELQDGVVGKVVMSGVVVRFDISLDDIAKIEDDETRGFMLDWLGLREVQNEGS